MGPALINKGLVTKVSSPAKYSLTEEGRKIAIVCAEKNARAENNAVNVYNPEGSTGINNGSINPMDEGNNLSLSVTSTPPPKRPKSTEGSFVLWATGIVSELQAAGHDGDKLQSSMNAVMSSGIQPSTRSGLRVAILANLNSDPNANTSSTPKNSNVAGSHARTPTNGNGANVYLYLDAREKLGRKATQNAERFASEIKNEGIPTEIKTLPVGDALFVRKCPRTGRETLLNFVAERKIASDFSSSVSDRRIFRQVYGMQNSRLSRTTVVIEGSFGGNVDPKHVERLEKTVAEINTFHGVYVKRTRNTKETIAFYRSIYRQLSTQCASTSLSDENQGDISFPSWCEEMNNFNNSLTVEQLFLLQMQRVAGVGKKTAQSILEMGYKTIPQLEGALRDVSEDDGPLFLKKQAKEKGIAGFNVKSSKALYNLFAQDSYTT